MIDRSAFLALEQAISLRHTPPAVHTLASTHSHALVYHKLKRLQLLTSIPTLVYQLSLVNIFYSANHKSMFHTRFHPHLVADFALSDILRSLRSLRMTENEGLRMIEDSERQEAQVSRMRWLPDIFLLLMLPASFRGIFGAVH